MGGDEPWLYYKGGMEVIEGKNGRRPGEVREKSTRGLGRWQGRNGKKTGEAWEGDKGGWGEDTGGMGGGGWMRHGCLTKEEWK